MGRSDLGLLLVFLGLSAAGMLLQTGADLTYDEPNYLTIGNSIWERGIPALGWDRKPFGDNPMLVPAMVGPVWRSTASVGAARVAHWALFVLPGLVALAMVLRPHGPLAMTTGFGLMLLNQQHLIWSGHVNLDAGLGSWGFVVLCCYGTARCQPLGYAAMAAACLCKYQAVLLGLVLLAGWAGWIGQRRSGETGWLLRYAAAAVLPMGLWLGYLWILGALPLGANFERLAWGSGWTGAVRSVHGQPLLQIVGTRLTEISLVDLLLALIGIARWHKDGLLRLLVAYIGATFLFNLVGAALPGGFGNYLVPAYLPLAFCGGMAMAGQPSGWASRLAILLASFANGWMVVPFPRPMLVSTSAAVLAAAMWLGWQRAGTRWVLLAAAILYRCAYHLPVHLDARPDGDLRELLIEPARLGWQVGTVDDPRAPFWLGRPVFDAGARRSEMDWPKPEVFLLDGSWERKLSVQGRSKLAELLAGDYVLERTGGSYRRYLRRDLAPPFVPAPPSRPGAVGDDL